MRTPGVDNEDPHVDNEDPHVDDEDAGVDNEDAVVCLKRKMRAMDRERAGGRTGLEADAQGGDWTTMSAREWCGSRGERWRGG